MPVLDMEVHVLTLLLTHVKMASFSLWELAMSTCVKAGKPRMRDAAWLITLNQEKSPCHQLTLGQQLRDQLASLSFLPQLLTKVKPFALLISAKTIIRRMPIYLYPTLKIDKCLI